MENYVRQINENLTTHGQGNVAATSTAIKEPTKNESVSLNNDFLMKQALLSNSNMTMIKNFE
jgi:hypothetical protein